MIDYYLSFIIIKTRHMIRGIVSININHLISNTFKFNWRISESKHALAFILVADEVSIVIKTLTRMRVFIIISPVCNSCFIVQNIYVFLEVAVDMMSLEEAFFRWGCQEWVGMYVD